MSRLFTSLALTFALLFGSQSAHGAGALETSSPLLIDVPTIEGFHFEKGANMQVKLAKSLQSAYAEDVKVSFEILDDGNKWIKIDKSCLQFDGRSLVNSILVVPVASIVSEVTTKIIRIEAKISIGDQCKKQIISIKRKFTASALCSYIGDPHVSTFDGLTKTYGDIGTFFMIKSNETTVQVSQYACGGASCIDGVAMRHFDSFFMLKIRATERSLNFAELIETKSVGANITHKLAQEKNQIEINLDDGLQMTITALFWDHVNAWQLNVQILAPGTYQRRVRGICGNYDGQKENDEMVIPVPADLDYFKCRKICRVENDMSVVQFPPSPKCLDVCDAKPSSFISKQPETTNPVSSIGLDSSSSSSASSLRPSTTTGTSSSDSGTVAGVSTDSLRPSSTTGSSADSGTVAGVSTDSLRPSSTTGSSSDSGTVAGVSTDSSRPFSTRSSSDSGTVAGASTVSPSGTTTKTTSKTPTPTPTLCFPKIKMPERRNGNETIESYCERTLGGFKCTGEPDAEVLACSKDNEKFEDAKEHARKLLRQLNRSCVRFVGTLMRSPHECDRNKAKQLIADYKLKPCDKCRRGKE